MRRVWVLLVCGFGLEIHGSPFHFIITAFLVNAIEIYIKSENLNLLILCKHGLAF
jgi:hypothetical protein